MPLVTWWGSRQTASQPDEKLIGPDEKQIGGGPSAAYGHHTRCRYKEKPLVTEKQSDQKTMVSERPTLNETLKNGSGGWGDFFSAKDFFLCAVFALESTHERFAGPADPVR